MIKKFIIYSGVLFFCLWVGGLAVFAWKINNFTNIEDKKTDAIVVLTGGRNRIVEAIKLLEAGKAKRLFISGVDKTISLSNIKNVQHINPSGKLRIDIGHNASNTVENAIEATEWIKKNNIKSIILVTSNYHLARSLLEFREQNPDLEINLHPVYSEKIKKDWWTSRRTLSFLFKEYNKFLYVYLRNQFDK